MIHRGCWLVLVMFTSLCGGISGKRVNCYVKMLIQGAHAFSEIKIRPLYDFIRPHFVKNNTFLYAWKKIQKQTT